MKLFGICLVVLLCVNIASADVVRGIDIDFVTIGNAGNSGDTRAEANPSGCGAVAYEYRIGKYEITATQWQTINTSAEIGDSGYWSGDQPVAQISWYDAARFCNYLTTGDTEDGVYEFAEGSLTDIMDHQLAGLTYGVAYFLPTEDEWYKAAYYKPDGSGYSTFANGGEDIPPADNGWNYYGGLDNVPWDVDSEEAEREQNGTFNMMGNVWEWTETLIGSSFSIRGGSYYDPGLDHHYDYLSSSYRTTDPPDEAAFTDGFRVASIPEPATLSLLFLGGLALRRKNR